ncbi:hypothetical protein JOF56_010099 [Kibdelosporangium banguiense]|uniref:SRPBCC family protein n=1 Tax=Kibdelosporangium banguiense TaxID=1365924 RepID=A0ABS4TZ73_9PSEU|nr:hypothetical protein [Kibdelosporangium banguiense]MBP2329714.1 hypothetical protein [Kibdelosporangium banguiense]
MDENDLAVEKADEIWSNSSGDIASIRSHAASDSSLKSLVGNSARIAYCYVVKVPKLGHLLHFPVAQTCEGVNYEFDLGDVGIERATVVPFFLSASSPLVREVKFKGRTVITAATTSWVLPGGGIALVWKLKEETADDFVRAVYRRS